VVDHPTATITSSPPGMRDRPPHPNTTKPPPLFPHVGSTNRAKAFSSEVDTGSREENASNEESRALVLMQSEPKL
jgi:hypothetical protein